MGQRLIYRTYHFRPPAWRSPKQLNLQTLFLLLSLGGWLALYGGLGWWLWLNGIEKAGWLELWWGVACIALGVPVVLGWWSALRRWRARLRNRATPWPALNLDEVAQLTPSQFEEYVAQRIFARQGYQVDNIRDVKDGGVDIIVTDAHGRVAIVQCKLYSNSVGEPIVRDLYGVLIHHNAHMAYLVTNNNISSAARRWAAGKPIALIDGTMLLDLAQAEPQGWSG